MWETEHTYIDKYCLLKFQTDIVLICVNKDKKCTYLTTKPNSFIKAKVTLWTNFQVDLRHQDAVFKSDKIPQKHSKEQHKADIVELGIDLKEFYKSVEWDILSVPAQR